MPSFVMSWIWRWLALALLTAATPGAAGPLTSTTVLPPDSRSDSVDKEVQALEAAAAASRQLPESRKPQAPDPSAREPKFLADGRQSKLMERDRASRRKTLDRNASELAWKKWLQSPENRDPGVPPRRITPKSVFIAPSNCFEGRKIGGDCVPEHVVDEDAHKQYKQDYLNNLTAQRGGVVYEYDYDEPTEDGPLQMNLSLGPDFSAAASQIVTTTVPANEKKNGDQRPDSEVEAELERLKLKPAPFVALIVSPALGEHATTPHSKPKRDHDPTEESKREHDPTEEPKQEHDSTEESKRKHDLLDKPEREHDLLDKPEREHDLLDEPEREQDLLDEPEREQNPSDDHGQKEVIFGDVSEDTIVNRTQLEATADRQNAASTDRTQLDGPTTTTEKITAETPPKPEIEYANIGDAVKLISRYAEVTTDDSFKGERKRPTEDDGPLGTRTRQQHRRRPPPSIYADRLAEHVVYPRPPPDYPFRHVQEYWSHPERFLGPYARVNPRRHHHAYPRRPTPSRTDTGDLYRLLALRHWYGGDAAADR